MNKPFAWDNYSDQPTLLRDKSYKKQMRKKSLVSLMKMIFTALFILPFSIIAMPFIRRKEINSEEFFCMGVDFQREPEQSVKLLNELGVESILLRIKLWEMQSLEELHNFIHTCQDKHITLKIMQDREHIEDLELLKSDLTKIFTLLGSHVDLFEIGTTINRSKWGFFSTDEYLNFFKVAYDLKKSAFPEVNLIGSGVIDFEYHFTAHTLFNLMKLRYDGISSLLYVDRRGAPENRQLGFNLLDKIAWLSTLVWLSPKTAQKLYITEVNWPLSNTAPYAPTSEYECVDEKSYASFMLRYHLLALASQQVDFVAWHQLMAKGYGLVNNIDGMQKRVAFDVYKFMVQNLHNSQFLRLDIKRDYYILQFLADERLLQIHWSMKNTTLKREEYFEVYSQEGKKIESAILEIGEEPLYIFITEDVYS